MSDRPPLPDPVFVGFLPKRSSEIAAVSNCISSPPEDWIDRWAHNDYGFYDTEALAWSIVPAAEKSAFDLYAYRMFPIEVADEVHSFDVRPAPGDVPPDFEFLGYDIVSRSISAYFECSPLSCNGAAAEFGANEHSLIAQLADAHAGLLKIGLSDEGYEPGPYYLFSVYRKSTSS